MCESDEESRIIIPAEVAIKIVSQTNNIYLRECPCRVSAGNCPPDTWEVCLLFEGASAKRWISRTSHFTAGCCIARTENGRKQDDP